MEWSDALASSKAIDGSKGFMKKNKNRKQNCRIQGCADISLRVNNQYFGFKNYKPLNIIF